MLTDRQASELFAHALEAGLDEYGHLGICMGTRGDDSCDESACRMVRQVIRTALALGYLTSTRVDVPDDEAEATRVALRQALDAALPVEAV